MPARILIIEDNAANMELMAYLLRAFGYEVAEAVNGPAGIAAAADGMPDLVVCDIHLPKMDGYEVLARLRACACLDRLPVVAVTALAMVGDRERLLAAGFDGYIGKPIDPESFVHQVASYLPVVPPARAAAIHAEAAAGLPATGAGVTVLVVDDSAVNRELLRSTLEPFGYTLLMAEDVERGMALAMKRRFDMILCDVHMPQQDGFEFLRRVRAEPRLSGLPFLFLTATSGNWGESKRALELGASRFLQRPIEPHLLIRECQDCLHERPGARG